MASVTVNGKPALVLDGLSCRYLASVLVDWRRRLPAGVTLPEPLAEAITQIEQTAAQMADLSLRTSAVGHTEERDVILKVEVITVAVAAERLHKTPRQIRRYCNDKTLRARRVGGAWIVDASSVSEYERQHR